MFLFGIIIALFLFPSKSFAQIPSVYFNEMMWRGSEISTSDEWIELYNNSSEIIDLSGWQIYNDIKSEVMTTVQSGQIAPYDHFLVSNNSKDHLFSAGESILNTDPDFIDSSISLSNDKFQISLLDESGNKIDQAGDGKKPFFGEFNNCISSMQRSSFADGTISSNWRASENQENLDLTSSSFATPISSGAPKIEKLDLKNNSFALGEDTIIDFSYQVLDSRFDLNKIKIDLLDAGRILKTQTLAFGQSSFNFGKIENAKKVKISFIDLKGLSDFRFFDLSFYQNSKQIRFYEIMPHPSTVDWNKDKSLNTNDEFIELVNFSKQNINLNGWVIKDQKGKKFIIGDVDIKAEGFAVFFKNTTNISINDSEETLYLYNPSEVLNDKINVPSSSSKKDKSYSRWGDRWHYTDQPTPGAINEIVQNKMAKNLDPKSDLEGKRIKIKGEIIDADRSSFCLKIGKELVDVKFVGDFNEISGVKDIEFYAKITNNSDPILVAYRGDFQIKKSALLKNSGGIATLHLPEDQTTIIKTTIKRKTSFRLKNKKHLSKIVLGSNSDKEVASSNYPKFLVLFVGIISFMAIIQIYDFCCRE